MLSSYKLKDKKKGLNNNITFDFYIILFIIVNVPIVKIPIILD